MPEILTESFCERCGTRYTFQAAAAARGPLTRVRTLSKGFRNYVLSDESSLSEAMANARSEDLRRTSGEQLDAFHKAFNFCMSCRQYTCANCWNDQEGRCLSCAPTSDAAALASTIMIGSPFPIVDPVTSPAPGASGNGHAPAEANGHANGKIDGTDISAWPSIDLEPEAIGAAPAIDQHEADVEQPVAHASEAPISSERIAAMSGDTPLVEPAPDAAQVEIDPEAMAAAPDVAEPVVEAPPADPAAQAPVIEPLAFESSDTRTPAVADETPAADQIESDLIPDIEGWAASAAAQTSTLLGRFRAFPGRQAAPIPPKPAAPAHAEAPAAALEPPVPGPVAAMPPPVVVNPEPVAAAPEPSVVADAAPEVVEPLAVPLRTAAVGVVPVIDLGLQTPPLRPAVETPSPDSILEPVAEAESPTQVAEPAPIAADTQPVAPEPEPETIAAAAPTAQPAPSSAPAPTPTAPPVPMWQIVAPDAPAPSTAARPAPTGQPTWPPLTPQGVGDPQWPAAPAWPSTKPAPPGVSGADAVWAQSSRDLLNRPETGVQACVNCGLPLSARARFCRRCGTNQLSA